MLDWLIVGGGIHGTMLSLYLRRVGVPCERLRVVDPHPEPLSRWRRFTASTGMQFLRSPSVHNLDMDPFALDRFAAKWKERRRSRTFAWPYSRPSLELFQAHAAHLVRTHGLEDLRLRATARGLTRTAHGSWRVETGEGVLEARRVVLAVGAGDQPSWPEWARALEAEGGAVHHVFGPDFDRDLIPPSDAVAVVGGGITAVQLALALAQRAPGQVTLLSGHAMRIHQFDSDPGWLGPRYMEAYRRLQCPKARRRTILGARNRGSIPTDVAAALRGAVRDGMLRHWQARVSSAARDGEAVQLTLNQAPGTLLVRRVVLATGFLRTRPGGAWLDRAVAELSLRCAPCGFPLTDARLEWAPGLHVMGPLAELEVGPIARNISGAQVAATQLAAVARSA